MSTKTSFKRIALVTVAALGFGVLTSVAPASAAASYTASVSLSTTSLTCVGGVASTSGYCYIALKTTDDAGMENDLFANETITATVIGVPTSVDSTYTLANNKDDIFFAAATRSALSTFAADTTANGAAASGSYNITTAATESASSAAAADVTAAGVYWLGIRPDTGAVDKGTYTVRIRLTDATGFISQQNVSVRFVTSAADSGATITLSKAGDLYAGSALTYTTNNYVKAVLATADGGKIQVGSALSTGPVAPTLSGAIVDEDGAVLQTLDNVYDTGVAAQDHVAPTTSPALTAWDAYVNGSYGVYDASIDAASITAKNTQAVRVRYGSTSATLAMTGYAAVTPILADSVISVKASGITAVNLASGTPYAVPLTTTSAVVSVLAKSGSDVQVNKPLTFMVTWSGNQSAGDVSPKSATPTTVLTDSTGVASITVTNKNPANGAKATVLISGFTAAGASSTKVIDWAKSYPTTVTQSASQAVKIGATTVVTATVTDQFGLPVVGEVLQPAITGANANTTALATVTTDANGSASISVTDAKGVEASTTLGSDTVAFTTTNYNAAGAKVSGSTKLTYLAAVPVITAMTAWYSLDETPAVGTYLPVPTTGITNAGTYLTLPTTRDNSKLITAGSAAGDDLVAFRISTGAKLVPVVITGTKGTFVLGSIGQQLTTRTVITDADGYADFVGGSTAAGANTFTATAGTVSVSASMWLASATTTQARTVTLTQNAATSVVTATVTDRFGNPVSGGSVQISTTNGTLGNGQLTTVYTTDTNGSISVLPLGTSDATITATYTTASADVESIAGYVGATAVESTLAAGVKTATLKGITTGGGAVDAASAAADAAAEATDAANAATDAANAAAEAADAATAAAQDAADAVAALSTQVTEMFSALKKQITALTNLVIKIQKKVKA